MKSNICVLIVLIVSLYPQYLKNEFEATFYFSHLSQLEKQLSYRSEMAFYFSYYQQILSNPEFNLLNDSLTEFPNSINSYERFNIYPELVIAYVYKTFNYTGLLSKTCYSVSRNLNPDTIAIGLSNDFMEEKNTSFPSSYKQLTVPNNVLNCVGSKDTNDFYVSTVFIFYSLTPISILISSYTLSGSVTASIVSIMVFVGIHPVATRIHHTPSLRESFGYPLFLFQQFLILQLFKSKDKKLLQSILFVVQLFFVLSWQFSQFVLLTQVLSLFLSVLIVSSSIGSVNYLDRFISVLCTHLAVFFASFLALYCNKLFLSSIYLPTLLALLTVCFQIPKESSFSSLFKTLIKFTLINVLFISVQTRILPNESDASHIVDIFLTKVLPSQVKPTFHSLLYTCQKEFDFFPLQEILALVGDPLIISCFSVLVFKSILISHQIVMIRNNLNILDVFMLVQTFAFLFMALFIMRLRLFFFPNLIIFMTCAFPDIRKKTPKLYRIVVPILMASLAICMYQRVESRLAVGDEFSNLDDEVLIRWLGTLKLKKDGTPWVITGPMAILSNLRLSLMADQNMPPKFAITNHPHYENAEIRRRTIEAYSIYSLIDYSHAYTIYKRRLNTDLLIFDLAYCHDQNSKCSFANLYKYTDFNYRGEKPVCSIMLQTLSLDTKNRLLYPYFRIVFTSRSNRLYLLQVLYDI